MTPKTRLRPSDSNARTPPSRIPLISASSRKMSKMPRSCPPRSNSEIRFADAVARQELGGPPGGVNAARLEQVGPIDHPQHLLHVLLDDQHRQPAGADASHQLEHLLHEDRREPGGRLVEEEQSRFGHEGPADRAHLLLAPRHAAGELAAALAQAREQAIDDVELSAGLRPRRPHETGHLWVFLVAHAREEAPAL